jgi:hypothetical protein
MTSSLFKLTLLMFLSFDAICFTTAPQKLLRGFDVPTGRIVVVVVISIVGERKAKIESHANSLADTKPKYPIGSR